MVENDTVTEALYLAISDYVESIGGMVVVVGGVEVQHWPGEEFKFKVAVQCVGSRPTRGKDKPVERPSD